MKILFSYHVEFHVCDRLSARYGACDVRISVYSYPCSCLSIMINKEWSARTSILHRPARRKRFNFGNLRGKLTSILAGWIKIGGAIVRASTFHL